MVIAIIALLVALLLPALSSARVLSQRVACSSNVRGIGVSNISWANDNDGAFVPTIPAIGPLDMGVVTIWNQSINPDMFPRFDRFRGIGILAHQNYVDAQAFYCPSSTFDLAYGKQSTTYPLIGGWMPDPDDRPAGMSSMEAHYLYRATIAQPGSATGYRAANMEDPPNWAVMADLFSNHTRDRGVDQHHKEGYNVLYVDGRVWFNKDDERILVDLAGGPSYHTNYVYLEDAWDWIADQEFDN